MFDRIKSFVAYDPSAFLLMLVVVQLAVVGLLVAVSTQRILIAIGSMCQ